VHAVCHAASPADWPGWRGREREGRAEPGNYPTHWSPDTNIRWKAPIPGQGHASPILVGDSVFLTTGYPTGRGETLKRLAAWGVLALTAAVAGAGAVLALLACARGEPPSRGNVVSVAFFCLVLGVLLQLSHAALPRLGGQELTTDQRMECWLLSANIAALCFIVAAFPLAAWNRARGIAALFVASLPVPAILARPAPDYFNLYTPGRLGLELIWSAALPLAVPIAVLLAALWGRTPRATRHAPRLACLAAAILGLAAGILSFRLPPLHVVTFCAATWLVVEACGFGLRVGGWAKWFAVAAIAVGALGFLERNGLRVTRDFARAIVCLDRDTGAAKWTREGLRGPHPPMSHRNSPATPTPVADAERVYAWFGSAGAMCTDMEGKLLWANTEVPFDDVHGVGASPILADGLLIIPGTQPDAPYIAALDVATGKRVWTTELRPWPGGEGQARTPAIATVNGKKLLLVWAWEGTQKEGCLRALDLRSGNEFRRFPVATHNEQVASVVSDGDLLYLASSKEVLALGLAKLSRGEEPLAALVWTSTLKCRGQLVASPVLCNGLLFVVAAHRDAHCLDARTGELLWSQQLNGRGCMASPIAAGGAVYFPDVSGKTTVVAAERKFRKIAENDLGEPIWASPAPVRGRLYIRTTGHLWCIEEKP